MNTARLGNLWAQANGDTHKMAEALGEELGKSNFVTKAELWQALSVHAVAVVGLTVALVKLL